MVETEKFGNREKNYKNVNHNTLKIRLFELLQEEKVKFVDQFGVVHNVYDSNEDFLYMETPYFYKTKDISLQGNYNKCVDNALNKEKFKPLCKNKSTDTVSRLCEKCINCSKAFIGYEYSTFDGVLIPDISTGSNGKYKYWIEVVHSHTSTDAKRSIINNHKINCIEVSLNALYDGYYEDEGVFVIDCYYITNLNDDEYLKIKKALRIEREIYLLKVDLEDVMDIKFTKKPFSRFNLNYSKRHKRARINTSFNLSNHPYYREITFTEGDFKSNKISTIDSNKKKNEKKPYIDFFDSYDKEFFEKMTNASKSKGISYTSVCDYLSKKYTLDFNKVVEIEKFSNTLLYYIKNNLNLTVMNGLSSYYNEEFKNKYNIPKEDKVIIDKKIIQNYS